MTGKLWLCKVIGRAEPDPSIDTRKPYILQPLAEVILNEDSGETRPNSEHLRSDAGSEV